jgi:hypothetical protein
VLPDGKGWAMGEQSLSVDCSALAGAADELRRAGDTIAGARGPLAGIGRRAVSGTGQFSGSLEDGVATFVLSWRAALEVFSASASSVTTLTRRAAGVYSATEGALAAQMTAARGAQ